MGASRRSARLGLLFGAAVACSCLASTVRADSAPKLPERVIAVGPSGAWSPSGQQGGSMFGLELVYVKPFFWGTTGARMRVERGNVDAVYPYVEVGGWFFLNFGVGYSLGISRDREPWSNVHLFLGLPVPLFIDDRLGPFHMEPYYRPMWGKGPTVHEVGVLLKWLLLWEMPRPKTSAERAGGG